MPQVQQRSREEAKRQALRKYLLVLESEIGVQGIHLEDAQEQGLLAK